MEKLTYTFTLVQGESETQEAFMERIQQVVTYAWQLSRPLEKPAPINFDDESKFRKIGLSSYELIVPDKDIAE